MPRRAHNPIPDRLRFIAKQYKRVMPLYWATVAAMELEGVHHVQPPNPAAGKNELMQFIDRLSAEGHLGRNPYEKYLPWVAQQVNKIYKRAARIQDSASTYEEAWASVAETEDLAQDIARRLRSIAQWAEASGVDLGKVDAKTAIREAQDFQLLHAQEAITQGDVVLSFPDGFTAQKLRTFDELQDEDEAMGHCVGDYCDAVAAGETDIYSIRDPKGRPHVTIEVDAKTGHVVQVRGKQNVEPEHKYWPYVGGLFTELGISREGPEPPPDVLEAFEEAYQYTQKVAEDAREAQGYVAAAIEAYQEGRYDDALEAAGEAATVEGKYGDDPATGFFSAALERALDAVIEAARAAISAAPHLPPDLRAEALEELEDVLYDDVQDFLTDLEGPSWAPVHQTVAKARTQQLPGLREAAEPVKAWTGLAWDMPMEIRGEEFEFLYDASTFDLVDPEDPEEGIRQVAFAFAQERGWLPEHEDVAKYIDAYEHMRFRKYRKLKNRLLR